MLSLIIFQNAMKRVSQISEDRNPIFTGINLLNKYKNDKLFDSFNLQQQID